MADTELIKFRLSPHAKGRITRCAERQEKSVASFMRDLAAEAVLGRASSATVRSDMAAFRQLANTVLTYAQSLGDDHPLAVRLREVGTRMRELASRHLRAAQ